MGLKPDGQLTVSEQTFEHSIGLAAPSSPSLYLVSLYQIWRLENALPAGQTTEEGCDCVCIPQTGYTTGRLNIHDLAVGEDGQISFACTAFNCLATTSQTQNFIPLWQPPFLSKFGMVHFSHI